MAATKGCRAAAVLATLGMLAPLVQAQEPSPVAGCPPAGMNGQCNELGTILMDFQKDVQGEPLELSARITIDNLYRERETRAFLFSVRNVSTEDGPSPVVLELVNFATAAGPLAVTKQERNGPNELNLWVDILDIPVGEPIDLTVRVGSKDRGAYQLETLVMPFDRAYHPIRGAGGQDLSLFAFTFLVVRKPTSADLGTGGGTFGTNLFNAIPGPEPLLVVAGVVALAVVLRRPPRAGGSSLQVFRRP